MQAIYRLALGAPATATSICKTKGCQNPLHWSLGTEKELDADDVNKFLIWELKVLDDWNDFQYASRHSAESAYKIIKEVLAGERPHAFPLLAEMLKVANNTLKQEESANIATLARILQELEDEPHDPVWLQVAHDFLKDAGNYGPSFRVLFKDAHLSADLQKLDALIAEHLNGKEKV
jgi:hypothetical protein